MVFKNIKLLVKKSDWLSEIWLSYKIRKAWMTRKSTKDDDHLLLYWDDEGENRQKIVDILANILTDKDNQCESIMDFGCHVGTTFKLLSKKLPNIKMYAVEPNIEACDFLVQKLPLVNVYQLDDSKFINEDFSEHKIDICLINSVFYSMKSYRVFSVLKKISKMCNIIVIADSMSNLNGSKTIFNSEPVYFSHPYITWLNTLGFTQIDLIPAPTPTPQLEAFLIVRTISNEKIK